MAGLMHIWTHWDSSSIHRCKPDTIPPPGRRSRPRVPSPASKLFAVDVRWERETSFSNGVSLGLSHSGTDPMPRSSWPTQDELCDFLFICLFLCGLCVSFCFILAFLVLLFCCFDFFFFVLRERERTCNWIGREVRRICGRGKHD